MQRSASDRVWALSDTPVPARLATRAASRLRASGVSGGSLPSRRIRHERRTKPDVLRIVLSLPDRIVVMDVVLRLGEELIVPLLRVGGRLLSREELFVAELGRTLERRDRVVGPEALQIRATVRGSRYRATARGITGARLRTLANNS